MAYKKTRKSRVEEVTPADDDLVTAQGFISSWARTTQVARQHFARDYEYTDGNGKQWLAKDRAKLEKQGRPVIEINQVLPQVLLVAGMHRDAKLGISCKPRGMEDARLSEVTSAALRATMDFARVPRVTDRVTDDSIICGLGVWEILHKIDDAEDLVFGDITAERIPPDSFIYDPWALTSAEGLQNGQFMGKWSWFSKDDFLDEFPDHAGYATTGEWMNIPNKFGQSSGDLLGTSDQLLAEMWDPINGRVRVVTLWCKKAVPITLVVDHNSGRVYNMPDKDKARAFLAAMAEKAGRDAVAQFEPIQSDRTSAVVLKGTAITAPDMFSGLPMEFADPESANAHLNALSQRVGMGVYQQFEVITRKTKKPYFYKMVWNEILKEGYSPFRDRMYPFAVLIGQQFSDTPESIMGIVRPLHDPQDEFNKRYSNLLANLNSSVSSGWFNRKSGGANTRLLSEVGSRPGVVVEYQSIKPERIQPMEMSQGHFMLLNLQQQNIRVSSGVNADMMGANNSTTVSGRAIRARQAGGATVLKPRLRRYEEAYLDLAKLWLSRVQQFCPPEKLKRIIGVFEMGAPLGANNMPIFTDPLTGQPMPEALIYQTLATLTNIQFDLKLDVTPNTDSERQAQFEKGMSMTQVLTSTGRPVGPGTFAALCDMADLPTRFAEGLKRDMMLPPSMPPQGGGGAIGNAMNAIKGGAAGGGANSFGGAPSSGEGMEGTSGGQGEKKEQE